LKPLQAATAARRPRAAHAEPRAMGALA